MTSKLTIISSDLNRIINQASEDTSLSTAAYYATDDVFSGHAKTASGSGAPHENMAALFDLAHRRPCGGGNSGMVRELNGRLKAADEAKEQLTRSARELATQLSAKSEEFRPQVEQWETTCKSAIKNAESALQILDEVHATNKDAEACRSEMLDARAPLVAWAKKQGADANAEDAATRWLALAAEKQDNDPDKTFEAWAETEDALAVEAHTKAIWLPDPVELPNAKAFAKAVKFYTDWKICQGNYDNQRSKVDATLKSVESLQDDAEEAIDTALTELEKVVKWVHHEAIPYEDSAIARAARDTAVATIAGGKSNFLNAQLRLNSLSKDILLKRSHHHLEMQNIRATQEFMEYTKRHDEAGYALQAQLKKELECVEQRYQEAQKRADAAAEASRLVQEELQKVHRQQEMNDAHLQMRLEAVMPSNISRQAHISRNSCVAPTIRDSRIASQEAHHFATTLREKLGASVGKLCESNADTDGWEQDVAEAFAAWEPSVGIKQALIESACATAPYEDFEIDIQCVLNEFAAQTVRAAEDLWRLNARKPEVAAQRVRELVAQRWEWSQLTLAYRLDEWLKSVAKEV